MYDATFRQLNFVFVTIQNLNVDELRPFVSKVSKLLNGQTINKVNGVRPTAVTQSLKHSTYKMEYQKIDCYLGVQLPK